MGLPIRAFWAMNSMMGRVMAERDLRTLSITNSAQSVEGANSSRDNLILEMGEMMQTNPLAAQRDDKGFQGLRLLK